MAIERQSHTTNTTTAGYALYDDNWKGQTFLTVAAYTIDSVKIKMYRKNDPGIVTVGIYEVDINLRPTGVALTTATMTGTDITDDTDGAVYEFDLTNYALTAATTYAIVISCTGGNVLNAIFPFYSIDEGYTDGKMVTSNNGGVGWSDGTAGCDFYFTTYSPGLVTPDSKVTKQLVAASLSEIWYESAAGTMTQLADSVGNINAEAYALSMFEAYGKVFVCNGTVKKVIDFTNYKIQTDDIKDTVAGATSYPMHGTKITGAGGAGMIVDYITAIDDAAYIYGKKTNTTAFVAGELVSGTNSDDTTVKFDIKAGTTETAPTIPHFYDWTVYGNSSIYGVMPDKATAGCNWRGRALISGDEDYSHQWYMPRQANPWDWHWVANDAGAPIRGGNSEQAGEVGDDVITIIPYNKDYLIVGCANSLWNFAGDPAEGGSLLQFDDTAGILGADAWCKDKEGNLIIVATTGILIIPKGFGGAKNLTEESYPDFIKDLAYTPGTHKLTVAYDRQRHGINIFKTTLATGANSCWWYDLKTGGLFPESYNAEHGVFSAFYYEASNPDYKKLLLGCNNGYVYAHDDDAKSDALADDSNSAIDSYVTFGPIPLDKENNEGVINSLVGVTTGGLSGDTLTDSNNVTYKMWVGRSADEVVGKLKANTSPNVSGTITAPGRGRGAYHRKKVRGVFAGIRIGNSTAAQTWGLERLLISGKKGGKSK